MEICFFSFTERIEIFLNFSGQRIECLASHSNSSELLEKPSQTKTKMFINCLSNTKLQKKNPSIVCILMTEVYSKFQLLTEHITVFTYWRGHMEKGCDS